MCCTNLNAYMFMKSLKLHCFWYFVNIIHFVQKLYFFLFSGFGTESLCIYFLAILNDGTSALIFLTIGVGMSGFTISGTQLSNIYKLNIYTVKSSIPWVFKFRNLSKLIGRCPKLWHVKQRKHKLKMDHVTCKGVHVLQPLHLDTQVC